VLETTVPRPAQAAGELEDEYAARAHGFETSAEAAARGSGEEVRKNLNILCVDAGSSPSPSAAASVPPAEPAPETAAVSDTRQRL
jgi:hypothetical protein